MCLIIDASRASCISEKNNNKLGLTLLRRLLSGQIKLATGGKNLEELAKAGSEVQKVLLQLRQSGDMISYSDRAINIAEAALKKMSAVRSNDTHNLALAIVSGAHVLVTNDDDFAADFRDASIVPIRRHCGKKVFREEAHSGQAKAAICCRCIPEG